LVMFACGPYRNLLFAFTWLHYSSARPLNVYSEPLAACGTRPGSGEGDQCTYRSYDYGAHQVCVERLPHSFSSRTGQGPWSNSYTGRSWCICIWAYANYFLTYTDSDLPVKCSALPSQVLESEYSLAKFKNCGAMSSHCDKFASAVARMCRVCALQAQSDSGRVELLRRCNAMRAASGSTATQISWPEEANLQNLSTSGTSEVCSAESGAMC